jgi:pimeloyl-ACP methyl ester carboxylesterase
MNKYFLPLFTLFLLLVLNMPAAGAQPIKPLGEKIGLDRQGTTIYQVPANGVKLGYKLIGSGEPLVMIAGLANTMDVWPIEVIETLAKRFQLIIPDNRGMGHSTANNTTFTYKLFADDVIGLLDALGVEKTNVIGFSMGSTITQQLLLAYPQRFNKAVIYATSTDGSKVADALRGKAPKDPDVMRKINPTILRQIEATTHWKTPLDKMSLVTNQVMFLVGTSDTVVGVEGSKALAAAIPGAWLVQFKNGTHGVMGETPREFARIVLTFLDMNETVDPK